MITTKLIAYPTLLVFFATSLNYIGLPINAYLGHTIQTAGKTIGSHIGTFSSALLIGSSQQGFNEINRTLCEANTSAIMGRMIRDEMNKITVHVGEGLTQGIDQTIGAAIRHSYTHIFPFAIGGLVAWTATPLVIKYLYEKIMRAIGRPKLATEVFQRTIFTPLTELLAQSPKAPIFNANITKRIQEIACTTQNIRKNHGYFPNVLFYGPGGTGKTMLSDWIAKNSGLSYIKMSGGDLAQYIKRGEHVTELNKLIDKLSGSWRPWSTRPWLLFIDEAESLCRDRDKIPTPELLELQNAFLNRTGTQNKRFMMVLATNRMDDLDKAVVDRMDYKIYVGPPQKLERFRIINSYIPQFFTASEQKQFFTRSLVNALAEKTDGFTGRALFKLLNAIANKKSTTQENQLNQNLINETVQAFVLQEKEMEKQRAEKKALQNNLTPNITNNFASGQRAKYQKHLNSKATEPFVTQKV